MRTAICLALGMLAAAASPLAQALLPAGSDHTKVLTYGGTFVSDGYRLSDAERDIQRRTASTIERALQPVTHDAVWQVTSVDEFRQREDEVIPSAPARAGLMICVYTVELELDHDSQPFKDLMARNDRRNQDIKRLAAEAQAAAARGDRLAFERLQRGALGPVPPTVRVRVETNPRDVSRYLNPENLKMTVAGADVGFMTPADPGNGVTTTTVGLGAIVKNPTGDGSFIKLKPSRQWATQHFVEVSIVGDPDLAGRVLSHIDFTELRHVLD